MRNPYEPEPQKPDDSWEAAICQGREDEFLSDYTAIRKRAAEDCSGCPLKMRCYEGAVRRRERFGIFGGVDFTPPQWAAQ